MGFIDSRLQKVLQIAQPGTRLPIIVETLKIPSSSDVQELSQYITVKRTSAYVNQIYGYADEYGIKNVAGLSFVSRVFYDEPVSKFQVNLPSVTFSKTDIHIPISDSAQFIGATELHDIGIKGKGITVAVVDTGTNKYHPLLEGAVIKQINVAKENGAEFADIQDGNGHGCCHPDTVVYTSLGLKRIEDLYESINADEIVCDNSSIKKLSDELFTVSFKDNNMEKCLVTHAHKVEVEGELIKVNDLLLTPWHKCYIFDKENWKIIEKRADEIKIEDYLISPSYFIELNDNYLDEEIAYLIGVIAGDGHVEKYRIRIAMDSLEVLEKCISICNYNDIKVSDIKYYNRHVPRIEISGWFVKFIVKLGLKTSSIDVAVPDIVLNSSEESIKSFIAGVIDTDGSVTRKRVNITSISKDFIYRLSNIISLIGGKPHILERVPRGGHLLNNKLIIGKHNSYDLTFDSSCIMGVCSYKINTISFDKLHSNKDSIPISQGNLKTYLYNNFKIKFDQNYKLIENNSVTLQSSYIYNITRNKLLDTLELLHLTCLDLYDICKNFKFIEVKSISKESHNGYFYDLTVKDSNNYLAGVTNMVFIHNTHVATTIAGRDLVIYSKLFEKNLRLHGVAPEASLLGIKVLDDEGSGQTSWVMEGIEEAVNEGADIINLSLGSLWDGAGMSPDSKLINELTFNHNILFSVAAGNNFANFTIGSPGGANGSITVASNSIRIPVPGAVSTFSSKGATSDGRIKPDISAPGGNLLNVKEAIYAGTSGALAEEAGEPYVGLLGTSMSTPHVSGALALLLQAGMKRDRYYIEDLLAYSAKYRHIKDVYTGYGMIDVKKAYDAIIKNEKLVPVSSIIRVANEFTKPLANLIPKQEEAINAREVRLPYLR